MSKEYVYANARWTAPFLRFRRYVQMSSDLPYALVSWSYVSRKTTFSSPDPQMDSTSLQLVKQAKLGIPTAAGDRRRLGVTARA